MQNSNSPPSKNDMLSRAQGCLLGQLAGDALGGLVEIQGPETILRKYPNGVRELADGGTWGTIAGQPTDDSEMALLLARMLIKTGKYSPENARKEYVYWLDSEPFDCGFTISAGLRGSPDYESQANGAMMRISSLGVFGANHDLVDVAEWARLDAALTHPNPVCLQANALFTMAIAYAVKSGVDAVELHRKITLWAEKMEVDSNLMKAIDASSTHAPDEYVHQQGWVLIAFQNALWQLKHTYNLEEAICDTVMRGGDTDTNAAICGALLGAVYGRDAVPEQWVKSILACRPEKGNTNSNHPRPECFWPVDVLELAEKLIN